MSDLLRITTPVAPKDYTFNQGVKPQTPEQVFELGNVDYINKTNTRDEQLGEQNLKDQTGTGLPNLNTAILKDPALTAVLLKGLVGKDAMAAVEASGNVELLSKVTEFADEILLSPESIAADILRQQGEATMFSGELWAALKDMVSGLAGTAAEGEINAAVLDFLKAAASAESRESVLSSISAGLRYLAKETAQSRDLATLLNQTADKLNAENFSVVKNDVLALVNYLEKSLLLNNKTQNLLSLITYNLSRFNGSNTDLGESFQAILNMAPDAETADKLNLLFTKFVEQANIPSEVKLSALQDNPSASAQRSMTMLTNRLAEAVNQGLQKIAPEELSRNLSRINVNKGTESIKEILSPLIPDNMKGALNTLIRSFESSKDLNTLIDRLSIIVNKIDNMESKVTVAQSINLVLSDMAQAVGVNYRPPTTMENMLDFLLKNINDPSLKSLSALNSSEMLQSFLTSPGVFTPLLHFLVPMDMDGVKAFGELWVDPEAENGGGTQEDSNHLFLCFEIENTGYFELEVYTGGKNISVALLCPEGTERTFAPLKNAVPEIAAACGYNAEKTVIGPLKRKRDLTNVFPKLKERRSGLNVSI